MVFRNICIFVLSTKLASALEGLTLMLLVANLANTKEAKNLKKKKKKKRMTEILARTRLRVFSESYQMNTNMTRLRLFSKI